MRPLRLLTTASLIAMGSLLGGCDFASFSSSQSSTQGIGSDRDTRTVDRFLSAIARGEPTEAAREVATDSNPASIVQALSDGPLRRVDNVHWTSRTRRTNLTGREDVTLEGQARLANGNELPIRARLTLIDNRYAVVAIEQTGQQRAGAPREVLASSTSIETAPTRTESPLPPLATSQPTSDPAASVKTLGSGTVTSAPANLPTPTETPAAPRLNQQTSGPVAPAQAPPQRVAQATPQPAPAPPAAETAPQPQAPVQPRIVQQPQPQPAPVPPQQAAPQPPAPQPGAAPQPAQPRVATPQPTQPTPRQAQPQQRPAAGAPLPPPVQQSDIPDEPTRIALVQETMHLIVGALASNDFTTLHGNSSRFLQQSQSVRDLERGLRIAFRGIPVDQNTLANRQPRLIGQPFLHQDGMWRQQGVYDLGRQRIAFRFAFTAEDGVWKLGRFIVQQGGLAPATR
ncbi:MAG: hypothetical protein RL291_2087 [Pseudomonadota bacterium]|jgi:hypothetical protein